MTVQTIIPAASNHDADQANTTMSLTGTTNAVGPSSWVGLLLAAVVATTGDTINSATLYYKSTSTSHDDPVINWYAQAADHPGVFTTTASDISNRPRGTAVVADSATAIGTTTYRAINIKTLIEEAIARTGRVTGNNIALIGDGLAGSDLWMGSYDNGAVRWYVEIDYTAGVAIGAIMRHHLDMMNG